jgi:hypothetical protein
MRTCECGGNDTAGHHPNCPNLPMEDDEMPSVEEALDYVGRYSPPWKLRRAECSLLDAALVLADEVRQLRRRLAQASAK